jgi:hypothetical protein
MSTSGILGFPSLLTGSMMVITKITQCNDRLRSREVRGISTICQCNLRIMMIARSYKYCNFGIFMNSVLFSLSNGTWEIRTKANVSGHRSLA